MRKKIFEILDKYWFYLRWQIWDDFPYWLKWKKRDFITFIGWAKVIILGGLIIGYFATKELFEKREKKGGGI